MRVTTDDHQRIGVTTVRVLGLQDPRESCAKVLRYDPLTGGPI
ncbi:hypothetical protein [Streptomyces chromofuscus]|nr:hypothetical protein [Streptomyces chromofuscus]